MKRIIIEISRSTCRHSEARTDPPPLKSALRNTFTLSKSSLAVIVVGVISAKIWAVLVGPVGVGRYGLLQGLLAICGLLASAGIGVGLVREGASALANQNQDRVDALRRAARLLLIGTGGLAILLLVLFRLRISEWVLGGPEHATEVLLVGVALLFTLGLGLFSSTLNAHHRVKALASLAIAQSLIGASAGWLMIWLWGQQGIAPAIICTAASGCLLAYYFMRKEIGTPARPTTPQVRAAASTLLRFGLPYTASMLVGTGVQLLLPIMVLHLLGQVSVGYYQAAVSISVGYLGFLLTAMAQDYYPRVSAVKDQPQALIKLINEQHRLLMLLATPVVLGLLALVSQVVPLLLSQQFMPTVELLEWQLIGVLLKFSSWTMAFVILARSRGSTYFITELIAGVTTVGATWLAVRWFGLAGLGIGYVVTYLVYYLVVWLITRRDLRLRWTRSNSGLLLGAIAAALLLLWLPAVGLGWLRIPVGLCLATISTLGSAALIRKEFKSAEVVDEPKVP